MYHDCYIVVMFLFIEGGEADPWEDEQLSAGAK